MDKLIKILQENNGVITYRDIENNHLSYANVNSLIREGELKIDERGIYRYADAYVDEYFSLQYRFSKGVYSLETALWLHGLSLTIPNEPVMTFPYGTNTLAIRQAGIKPIIARSFHELGIIEMERQVGQNIFVYDMERTLVECLRSVHHVDVQIIAPAFKSYFNEQQPNVSKLFEYAHLFKVEKKLQSYIEVLL